MKKIFILLTIIILSACSYQRFNFSDKQPVTYPYETKSNFFVSGIGQTDNINLKEICGSASQVETIETSYSFTDGLLTLFTYGIWSPKTYKVWCKGN
jgi:hypothetical protein